MDQMRWEKDTRYYETRLHQDLWGQWVLTRVWGRRNTPMGKVTHTPCRSHAEALRLVCEIAAAARATAMPSA